MSLTQEQQDQNQQALLNDQREHFREASRVARAAIDLLGDVDKYLLVSSKKGYLLTGINQVTNDSLVGFAFDAAAYHTFISAITAIAKMAKSAKVDWTGKIAPLVKV